MLKNKEKIEKEHEVVDKKVAGFIKKLSY